MVKTEIEADFERFRTTGDPEALARVFDATAQKLLLLAAHVTGDHALAEDMVQNTFLIAVERAGNFGRGRPLLPWLSGILVQEARMELRRRRRRPDPQRMPSVVQAMPDEELAADELGRLLTEAIEAMPATYRQVLNLHLVHGLKSVEIAHALGMPAETVRTQLHRGLPMLRKILPAGLASSIMLLTSGSGLAAMRTVVLQKAGEYVPASVAIATGGVLAKKWVLSVAAVLLVLLPVSSLALDSVPEKIEAEVGLQAPVSLAPVAREEVAELGVDEREIFAPTEDFDGRWLLTGSVRDENGDPILGAKVGVRVERGELVTELGETTSDAQGRYTFDFGMLRELGIFQRARAKLKATASHPGYVPKANRSVGGLPWGVEGAAELSVDLELMPGAWLRGRVLRSDLSPAAGVSIDSWHGSPSRLDATTGPMGLRRMVVADAGGRYEVPLVEAGYVALMAESQSDGRARLLLGDHGIEMDVEVADMVLQPFASMTGRLVLEDGLPLAMRRILFSRRGDQDELAKPWRALGLQPWRGGHVITAADGSYRISGLASGEYSLRVVNDLQEEQEFVVSTEDSARDHVVKGQLLTLKVRDGEDRALPGLSIDSQGWPAERAPSLYEQRDAMRGGKPLSMTQKTAGFGMLDASGEGYFLLPEGSLSLFGSNQRGARSSAKFWRVEKGVYRAELTLRIQTAGEVGYLAFDLRDELGRRVDEYQAHITDNLGVFVGVFDAEDAPHELSPGKYRVLLLSGPQKLRVAQNFRLTAVVEVVNGETTHSSLRVRRGGYVRLNLGIAQGDEVEVWRGLNVETDHPRQEDLHLTGFHYPSPRGGMSMSFSPPVGESLLCAELFEPGGHVLMINAEGYEEVQVPVLVLAGEVVDVEVTMFRK